MSFDESMQYFESEKNKIWEKLLSLEEQIKNNISEYERIAKQSLEQTLIIKDKSEESKISIIENLNESIEKINKIRENYSSFENQANEINNIIESVKQNNDKIKGIYDNIDNRAVTIENQIISIEKIIEKKPLIELNLIKLEEIFTNGNDFDNKINTIYKSSYDKKIEFDKLFIEIMGYVDKTRKVMMYLLKVRRMNYKIHIKKLNYNLKNFKKMF